MNTEVTTEMMNVTISRFMGMEGTDEFIRQNYQYHKSWELLMPVVEKIETLSDLIVNKVWISINGKSCGIWTYFDVRDVLRSHMPIDTFKVRCASKTKIEATHEAVYQFITWYQNKK